jgi:hypothetical protein
LPVRKDYYDDAIKVAGSEITPNIAPREITDVYVPDLGKGGNKIYWQTLEGGGPRIEEGSHEPFYFEIMYSSDKNPAAVHVEATMIGENPVFYILLPPSVKSRENLADLINSDDVKRIAPLVDFDKKLTNRKLGKNDIPLTEFFEQTGAAQRGSLVVSGDRVATIRFTASGTLKSIVENIAICLGQGESIATCYRGVLD